MNAGAMQATRFDDVTQGGTEGGERESVLAGGGQHSLHVERDLVAGPERLERHLHVLRRP